MEFPRVSNRVFNPVFPPSAWCLLVIWRIGHRTETVIETLSFLSFSIHVALSTPDSPKLVAIAACYLHRSGCCSCCPYYAAPIEHHTDAPVAFHAVPFGSSGPGAASSSASQLPLPLSPATFLDRVESFSRSRTPFG